MFRGAKNITTFTADNFFDETSGNVRDMSEMFRGASSFNEDINSWDVSNVTSTFRMFLAAESFNSSIKDWDVSSVKTMRSMFEEAYDFNQDIGDWDVSNVKDMSRMFWSITQDNHFSVFNQDISGWDVSNVKDMKSMFYGAERFDKDIGGWDVSSVEDMSFMFSYAESFNQYIGAWDVFEVSDMSYMFEKAKAFNHYIGRWDVSKVTSMRGMFRDAVTFNYDIGEWDVSNVEDMGSMFEAADAFNQDIGGWDVSNVEDMSWMFRTNTWDGRCTAFNQDISGWDVSNVKDMNMMFYDIRSFKQDIGDWDVSNVEDMSSMFEKASRYKFDPKLYKWDVSNVKNFKDFLKSSGLSTETYNELLIRWSELDLQENINFHGGISNYDIGLPEIKRKNIIDEFNWTFEDRESSGDSYSLKAYTYHFIHNNIPIAKITISTFAFDHSAIVEVNELSLEQKNKTERADKKLPPGSKSRAIPVRDYKVVNLEGEEADPSESPEAVTLRFYFPLDIVYADFKTTKIARLCEDSEKWLEFENYTLNNEEKWIEIKTDKLSVYTLIISPHETLENVYVYPNPFKPSDREYGSAYGGRGIKFAGLPNEAEIRIFNIAGYLIEEFNHEGSTSLRWEEAEKMSSGVYILVVNHNGDLKTRKFSIVK